MCMFMCIYINEYKCISININMSICLYTHLYIYYRCTHLYVRNIIYTYIYMVMYTYTYMIYVYNYSPSTPLTYTLHISKVKQLAWNLWWPLIQTAFSWGAHHQPIGVRDNLGTTYSNCKILQLTPVLGDSRKDSNLILGRRPPPFHEP